MGQIIFPSTYDNEAAHREVKLMMMQGRQLDIQVEEEEVWVSSQGVTGLRYLLNDDSWKWILGYLQTGDYEDFGVFPSDVSLIVEDGFKEIKVRELIDQCCDIASIPFHRETEAFIWLIASFKFGKLIFKVRRTDNFINYLIDKEIW